MIGARFVFGETKPGDEYIMTAFGQKIILSKSEVEDFMDEKGGKSYSRSVCKIFNVLEVVICSRKKGHQMYRFSQFANNMNWGHQDYS